MFLLLLCFVWLYLLLLLFPITTQSVCWCISNSVCMYTFVFIRIWQCIIILKSGLLSTQVDCLLCRIQCTMYTLHTHTSIDVLHLFGPFRTSISRYCMWLCAVRNTPIPWCLSQLTHTAIDGPYFDKVLRFSNMFDKHIIKYNKYNVKRSKVINDNSFVLCYRSYVKMQLLSSPFIYRQYR